jgi:hypothetical protein
VSANEHARRDVGFELLLLRELCAGLNIDTSILARLAAHRADAGADEYGHDFPDLQRDLELEGLEEGADWSNYLRWRLDGIRRGLFPGQEWKVEHLQAALRHIALAFEATRAARG